MWPWIVSLLCLTDHLMVNDIFNKNREIGKQWRVPYVESNGKVKNNIYWSTTLPIITKQPSSEHLLQEKERCFLLLLCSKIQYCVLAAVCGQMRTCYMTMTHTEKISSIFCTLHFEFFFSAIAANVLWSSSASVRSVPFLRHRGYRRKKNQGCL